MVENVRFSGVSVFRGTVAATPLGDELTATILQHFALHFTVNTGSIITYFLRTILFRDLAPLHTTGARDSGLAQCAG